MCHVGTLPPRGQKAVRFHRPKASNRNTSTAEGRARCIYSLTEPSVVLGLKASHFQEGFRCFETPHPGLQSNLTPAAFYRCDSCPPTSALGTGPIQRLSIRKHGELEMFFCNIRHVGGTAGRHEETVIGHRPPVSRSSWSPSSRLESGHPVCSRHPGRSSLCTSGLEA